MFLVLKTKLCYKASNKASQAEYWVPHFIVEQCWSSNKLPSRLKQKIENWDQVLCKNKLRQRVSQATINYWGPKHRWVSELLLCRREIFLSLISTFQQIMQLYLFCADSHFLYYLYWTFEPQSRWCRSPQLCISQIHYLFRSEKFLRSLAICALPRIHAQFLLHSIFFPWKYLHLKLLSEIQFWSFETVQWTVK